MSSIPLPALGGRPVEQPDLMGQYAKALALKQAMTQQQIQQQQIQAGDLENQQRQQALQMQAQKVKDQQTVTSLYVKHNGDLDKTIADAAKEGVTPETIQALQKHALDVKGQTMDLVSKQGAQALQQADLMKGAHEAVANASQQERPAVYQQSLMGLKNAGVDVSQMPVQYPGDEPFKLMGALVQGHKSQVDDALKQAEIAKNTQQANEAGIGALQKQQILSTTQGGITAEQRASNALRKTELNISAGRLGEEKRHNQATEGQLTPDALNMAADQFAETGVMPQVGRSGAVRSQIINAAAARNPGGNLAANSAAFKANEGSLKKLQTNFDQVTAFENTAGKNLDVFLGTAQKVVDSGSPWINRPLRMVAGSGLGSEDQAAFNAARQTAVTEIAKVLNSSNASGVLSDSARHEVEGLIGPSASLKQIVSAATILKQDMANRHQAYQDQIGAIQDRLKGAKGSTSTPSNPAAPAQGGDFFSNFGGKAR